MLNSLIRWTAALHVAMQIGTATAGGGVPIGATEGTQLLNNVELAAQVQQQIRTYQSLADQLDLMANNDRLLNSHNFHATGGRMLAELHRAVERDGLISYVGSSVNEEYDRVHPSYRDYARETYGIEAVTHANFRTWDEQRRANIKAALGYGQHQPQPGIDGGADARLDPATGARYRKPQGNHADRQ